MVLVIKSVECSQSLFFARKDKVIRVWKSIVLLLCGWWQCVIQKTPIRYNIIVRAIIVGKDGDFSG